MRTHNEECFHLGVKALILNQKKQLLLLERNHPQKGMYWDIPGGRLQKGETQIETLLREVREETGLENISGVRPFMMALTDIRISTHEGEFGLIFSVFILNLSNSFHPILSSEHVNFEWSPIQTASDRLKRQYPREFIENLSLLS